MTKPIVIAGNGPSLAKIDYSRLPIDFDVYRCNQFYFEESYFLGRDITAVFFNPAVFFQQYYTLKQLIANQEYTSCSHVYCSRMYWANEFIDRDSAFSFLYPDVIELHSIMQKYPSILSFLKYHDLYSQERVTSGILMVITAVINGYKDIYITGIDFYETEEYAFNHDKENIKQLLPDFNTNIKTYHHTKNIDIKTLQLLEQEFNIRIYSLSPQSPLSSLYPPPQHQRTLAFHVEQKKKSYTEDILFPSVKNPLIMGKSKKSWFKKEREQNLYIKVIEDFFRLFAFCIKGIKYMLRTKS